MTSLPDAPARWIVLDIEGTTSATESVHVGLFSYARPRLGPWIVAHSDDAEVAEAVAQVRATAGLSADAPVEDVIAILEGWVDADVKATPLKTLQGQIWAVGFADGDLTSHFFPDVPTALQAWRADGARLAVFSSGSVATQQPWYRHSAYGDLSVLVDAWFDTVNAGPKREAASYLSISESLGSSPLDLVFLSDVPAELDAALAAGWTTVGVRRPDEPFGDADFAPHRTIASFAELDLPQLTPEGTRS